MNKENNTEGYVWFCGNTKLDNIESPLHAELLGILFDLKVARNNNLNTLLVIK